MNPITTKSLEPSKNFLKLEILNFKNREIYMINMKSVQGTRTLICCQVL